MARHLKKKNKRKRTQGQSKDLKAKTKAGSKSNNITEQDGTSDTVHEERTRVEDPFPGTNSLSTGPTSQQTTYSTCWQYIREYYDYRASLKQSAYDIDIKKYVNDIVDEDDDLQDTFYWQSIGERRHRKNYRFKYPWIGLKSQICNSLQYQPPPFKDSGIRNVPFQDSGQRNVPLNDGEIKNEKFQDSEFRNVPFQDCGLRNISFIDSEVNNVPFTFSALKNTPFKDGGTKSGAEKESAQTDDDDGYLKRSLLQTLSTLLLNYETSWRDEFLRGYVGQIERLENRVKAMLICPQMEMLYLKHFKNLLTEFQQNRTIPLHYLIMMKYRLEWALRMTEEYQIPLSPEEERQEILVTRHSYRKERDRFLRIHPEMKHLVKSIDQVEHEAAGAKDKKDETVHSRHYVKTNINDQKITCPSPYVQPPWSDQKLLPGVRDFILQAQQTARPQYYNLFDPITEEDEFKKNQSGQKKLEELELNMNNVFGKDPCNPFNVTSTPSSYTSYTCTARPLSYNLSEASYNNDIFDSRICLPETLPNNSPLCDNTWTNSKQHNSALFNSSLQNSKTGESVFISNLPNSKTKDSIFNNPIYNRNNPFANMETSNKNPFVNETTMCTADANCGNKLMDDIFKAPILNETARGNVSANNTSDSPTWNPWGTSDAQNVPDSTTWDAPNVPDSTNGGANNATEQTTCTPGLEAQSSPQQMSGDVAHFFRQYASLYSKSREAVTVPDPFPTPWTYQHHPDALSRETPSSRTIEPHARPAEPINSRTHETNIPWSYEPGTPHFSTEEPNTCEDFKDASPADIECCEIQSKTRRGTRRSRGQDTRRSSHSARSRKKMEGKIPCKIFTKKIIKDKALPYKILTRGKTLEDFILETGRDQRQVSPKLRPAKSVRKISDSSNKYRPINRSSQHRTASSSLSIRYVSSQAKAKVSSSAEKKLPNDIEDWRIPHSEDESTSLSTNDYAVGELQCIETDPLDVPVHSVEGLEDFTNNMTALYVIERKLDSNNEASEKKQPGTSDNEPTSQGKAEIGDILRMAILRSADNESSVVSSESSESRAKRSKPMCPKLDSQPWLSYWKTSLWKKFKSSGATEENVEEERHSSGDGQMTFCTPADPNLKHKSGTIPDETKPVARATSDETNTLVDNAHGNDTSELPATSEEKDQATSLVKRNKEPTFDCLFRFKTNLARRISIVKQPDPSQQQEPTCTEVPLQPTGSTDQTTLLHKNKTEDNSTTSLYKRDRSSPTLTDNSSKSRSITPTKTFYKNTTLTFYKSRSTTPTRDLHKSDNRSTTPVASTSLHKSDKMKLALNAAYEFPPSDFHFNSVRETLKQFRIYRYWDGEKSEQQLSFERHWRTLGPRITFQYNLL